MLKICKILALFLILLPATSHAQSVLGTLPLDRGDKLWYMQAGMPDAEIGMMQGLSSLADVAPHVRIQYFPTGRLAKFGLGFGAGLRLRVAQFSGWHVAFNSDPELFFPIVSQGSDNSPDTRHLFGIRFGMPGIMVGHTFNNGVHAAFGVQAPLSVQWLPDATLNVPVFMAFTAEKPVTESLTGLLRVDVGGDYYSSGTPAMDLFLRVRMGIALL